jgi:hypothetical protein
MLEQMIQVLEQDQLEVQEHQIVLQDQQLHTLVVVEVEQVKEKVLLLQHQEDLEVLAVVELVVVQDYQEQHQVQFQEQLILEAVVEDLETQQGKMFQIEEQEQAVQVS